MYILNLCLVFTVIIVILTLKKPLFVAIYGGGVTVVVLYKIPFVEVIHLIIIGTFRQSTLKIVLSFYFITLLQRMLERISRLKQAQESLNGIFNNCRVNTSLAPSVIGLLPSSGALTICGSMVSDACEKYIDDEDMTFGTSFFRHIPERFLPRYSSILIAITLSGVSTSSFVIAMVPMVIVLFTLWYIYYLRKIPKDTGILKSENKNMEVVKLFKSLWSIILTVILILLLNLPLYVVTPIVLLINYFVDKFNFKEVVPLFESAIEKTIIFNTTLIMIFKEIIIYTWVINQLPEFGGKFSIPISLVFALIFFFGTIISDASAIISLCMPMAMATVPDAGLPLVVLLMCFSYAAKQTSPTHICLFIATDYFDTSMGELIKRTIPIVLCFCTVVIAYVELLSVLFKCV